MLHRERRATMMMPSLQIALAVTPMLLEVGAVLRMRRSHMGRVYPFFYSFLVFDIGRSLLTFTLWRLGPRAYKMFFYTYWTAEIISAALGLAVVYEIYGAAIADYEGLRDLGSVLFRWASAVLLLLAIGLAAAHNSKESHPVIAALLVLDQSARLLQAGLLLFVLLFKAQFGLAWRHPVFGIALGFALYACVQVVIFAVRAQFGQLDNPLVRLLVPVSYNLATITWLLHLWKTKPAAPPIKVQDGSELARWNQALLEAKPR